MASRHGRSDTDPSHPGLAFAKLPATVPIGGRFEVWVRLNDAEGSALADTVAPVTLSVASGSGRLAGTLTRETVRGVAYFDDLAYDAWEEIHLVASVPGYGSLTTQEPVTVRPVMRLHKPPPAQVPVADPLPPLQIEVVDGLGKPMTIDASVTLEDAEGKLAVPGGGARHFSAGLVSFEGVVFTAPGSRSLVFKSPGLADLVQGVVVYEGTSVQSLWLPGGRVGVPYVAHLPADFEDVALLRGALPRGLELDERGSIVGLPTAAGVGDLELSAIRSDGAGAARWFARLPIFGPPDASAGSLDPHAEVGPFQIGVRDETVHVASRGADVRVRIFLPTTSGQIAEGTFPIVVFHHGASAFVPDHPTIFDRFDPLLRTWASRGFVVATIDAPDLVWIDGRTTSSTLANLQAMSENQRAVIAFLTAKNGQAGDPLFGHLQTMRVIVAGHSRGGGAAILTASVEPAVVGGVLIKPLDPMAAAGGEKIWGGPLPEKPFLVVVAGKDNNVPYPIPDALYDRRTAPMSVVTIEGSLHSSSCSAWCEPDADVTADITPEEDWAVTNAYAGAFLDFVGRGDLAAAEALFGPAGLGTTLSPLGVQVRGDRFASALVVDDFQGGRSGINALGLPNSDQGFVRAEDEPSLVTAGRELPVAFAFLRALYARDDLLAQSNAHRLAWAAAGATWRAELGGLDVRGRAFFQLRARTDRDFLAADLLSFVFTDASGKATTVEGRGLSGPLGIGSRFSDVIVPLDGLSAAGLDLSRLSQVTIAFRGAGSLLLDDLRFE